MEEQKTKRIMIATPCLDGKLSAWYVDSLYNTIMVGASKGCTIIPVFIANDALVQRARNDLFHMAFEACEQKDNKLDKMVFIDSDIAWNPDQFFNLIGYDVDIVGGTYRKKQDFSEEYVLKVKEGKDPLQKNKDGLIEVAGLGMGFVSFTAKAIIKIYKKANKYKGDDGVEKRMVFNVTIEKGSLVSEDISMCNLWTAMKNKIYFDPNITVGHEGTKLFVGNFEKWLEKLN